MLYDRTVVDDRKAHKCDDVAHAIDGLVAAATDVFPHGKMIRNKSGYTLFHT